MRGPVSIRLRLRESQIVRLVIYNALGQQIRRLLDEARPAGVSIAVWDGLTDEGIETGSGVYFYRASCGGAEAKGRLVRLR